VHRVVRAQVEPLRDVAGGSRESGTQLDDPEGRDGSVEVPLRSRVVSRREPTGTARGREGGPSLRVRDPRRELPVLWVIINHSMVDHPPRGDGASLG